VGAVIVCTLFANRMTRTELGLAIFSIALAAGWSFSLRSHFVYGWDITSEYRVAQGTYGAGIWHPYHPKDAYSAMLSLTTFPATLQALAGTSSLFLLKAVYPVLFALFPVGLFSLASRLVGRRYAFVAAALLVVQGFFFQQMSGLARQEIGLLVFVALIATVLDSAIPRRAQWPLAVTFGLALVLSHYSTTYLAIDMLAGYCVIQLIVFALRRTRPVVTGAAVVALIVTVAGAWLWYARVTQSSSNASNFVTNVEQRGFDFLPNAKPGQSPLEEYLKGNIASRVEPNQFERDMVRQDARLAPWLNPLPSAGDPRYALRDASVPSEAVRSPAVVHALDIEQTLVSQR
jgi:uncharacterized membrane protein